ncbi:MAG TPA: glycosyltransferase family 4 protein [Pseudomonadales bacterium]|nr:glycosyltransferase family 4 protein [Pseudomonadales bacterium]
MGLDIALVGYRSNPYSGGQGIYIHYLSKALLEAGHRVDVISGPPYPDLVDGVGLIKIPSLDLFAVKSHVTALRPRHLRSWSDTYEYFSMLTGGFPEPYTFGRRLVNYFRQTRPRYDIVHDNQSLCWGTLKLQQSGIPLVTTIHHPITSDRDIALANEPDWGMRLLIKRWYSFVDMQTRVARQLKRIVTVSEQSKRDIIEAFAIEPARVSVIHNGIDTETFQPIPGIERDPMRIMATASADQPLKGLQYLLHAVAQLRETYPAIELVVLGKLKPNGDTDKLVSSLGLRDRIRFVSGIATSELVRLYAEAGIVVVPSVYEGFGLPAGEAMACGAPVISTCGGALPEVVGDAGLLVPVRDPAAIAAAVSRLIENDEERHRLAIAGRQRIQKLFSWKVTAAKMVDYYNAGLQDAA